MGFLILILVLNVVYLLLSLAAILFFIIKIVSIFTTDAPFLPIPPITVEELVKNVELSKNSVVYDLGCGDARVLTALAEKFTEARFVGVEIGAIPFILAKLKTRKFSNIELVR